MAGGYRRKKTHKCTKSISSTFRLRRRTKDLDQIAADIQTMSDKCLNPVAPSDLYEYDAELPGCGQFPCVSCSRHFCSAEVLGDHLKTKQHKKRLRQLKVKPYTLEEAAAAGGCSSADFYTAGHILSQ